MDKRSNHHPIRRRYQKELDGGEAFVHDNRHGFIPIREGDVEAMGEEFIAAATSNDPISEIARDEAYPADCGAFVIDLNDDIDDEVFDLI